jgi:hypothetical protein
VFQKGHGEADGHAEIRAAKAAHNGKRHPNHLAVADEQRAAGTAGSPANNKTFSMEAARCVSSPASFANKKRAGTERAVYSKTQLDARWGYSV